MHINRIDLNLFVVLDAIFSEGGITRASQKLQLSQPAVSHALGRLRGMFNDPLFVREGRAMVPTPLARSLIEPVRRSLRELEVTLNEHERFDPASTQKHFTVAVRDVLESTLLPPLMRYVIAQAPRIDIAAIRVDRRQLESELAMGTLDAAIDVLLPLSGKIQRRRIALDPVVVVARKNHPHLRSDFDLETYLRQEHVLVSSRRSGPGLEDVELSRLGLQRRIRLRCQHYFAACQVVSQTELVLTMPERHARVTNAPFGNQILPFPVETPRLDAYLYWHVNVDNEPASRWLREQLNAAFAS
ncbi:MAG: LysR family transcriptional regulator [Nevskiales bacterium]